MIKFLKKKTVLLLLVSLIFGCSAFETDPNEIEIMTPHRVAGGPSPRTSGEIEYNVVAWEVDAKFEDVFKFYDNYFKEQKPDWKKTKHGKGAIWRNDVVEAKLVSADRGARGEMRIARVTNGKPLPKTPGELTNSI